MPFMHGRAAVSRTLKYIQQGQITLSKHVRIMIFGYNAESQNCTDYPHHAGLLWVHVFHWESDIFGKSFESAHCAVLKACDACADMGQL